MACVETASAIYADPHAPAGHWIVPQGGQMPIAATQTTEHLKIGPGKPAALRDLWAHADIGTLTGARDFTVAPGRRSC